jgi:hypothetical protein
MKLRLNQSDVFRLLRIGLEQEGRLTVPDESESLMVLTQDDQGLLEVELEVTFSTAPQSAPLPATRTRTRQPVNDSRQEQPPPEVDTRLVPGPPPPPPVVVTHEAMEEEVTKSDALMRQPRPKLDRDVPARLRFPNPRAAANIEDFGKDPTDYADEIS